MRVLLGEEEFTKLISGGIVEQNGVKVALQDIGYARMLEIIEPKLQALLSK